MSVLQTIRIEFVDKRVFEIRQPTKVQL